MNSQTFGYSQHKQSAGLTAQIKLRLEFLHQCRHERILKPGHISEMHGIRILTKHVDHGLLHEIIPDRDPYYRVLLRSVPRGLDFKRRTRCGQIEIPSLGASLEPMSTQLTLFDKNRAFRQEPHNFGILILWKDAPRFVQRKVPNLPLQIDPWTSSPRRNPLPSTYLFSQFSLCRHIVIFTTVVRFEASPLNNFVRFAATSLLAKNTSALPIAARVSSALKL